MNPHDRLSPALWESRRHAEALGDALAEWRTLGDINHQRVEADRMLTRLVDQILFRFTKLQDSIGERLIPATLQLLAEPFEEWAMRDRLNRLEKLGYLNVDAWLRWRDLRNRLAHEYPDQPELRFANILATIGAAAELMDALAHWASLLPTSPWPAAPPAGARPAGD